MKYQGYVFTSPATPQRMTGDAVCGQPIIPMADVCCCAGGATYGYQDAGFHVTGVDVVAYGDYCGDMFMMADAVEFILDTTGQFEFYHASPPCQAYSAPTKGTNRTHRGSASPDYPDILYPIREALKRTGRPWVIENVRDAPIEKHLMLCGEMFGLGVLQERYFEFGGPRPSQPVHPEHRGYVRGWRHGVWRDGPYVAAYGQGGGKAKAWEIQAAKKIWWTHDRKALCEAIPPAYTEYIGGFIYEHLTGYKFMSKPARALDAIWQTQH